MNKYFKKLRELRTKLLSLSHGLSHRLRSGLVNDGWEISLRFIKRNKLAAWLAASFLFLLFFSLLLFHKPSGFKQPEPVETNEVSKYLTHVITPAIYNGAQLGEPFDLVITEDGINDVVAGLKWPQYAGWASFSTPRVSFKSGKIVLQAAADIDNIDIY